MIVLLVIVSTLVVVYLLLKSPKRTNVAKEFPEPPGHFLIGHIASINSPTTLLNVLSDFTKITGKTVKVRVGPAIAPASKGVITADHKLMEVILSSNHILTKADNYLFFKSWLGNGLLVSDGNYWRRHRKILTPAFHFGILKEFVETFENVGDVFINKLQMFNGSKSVDLHPLVTLCALDSICETVMGTKINAQSGENLKYVDAIREMCQLMIGRFFSPLKIFDSTYWLTKDYYIEKKLRKILHEFTLKVIDYKNKKRNERAGSRKKMAFLDLLLQLSNNDEKFTLEEIREEVDTFMFEGHDTTSSAICFTLFCMGEYPDIQKKVLEEQRELFQDEKNPVVTYTDFQNMKYLEKVIKETLRLYPSVPILGRYAKEDIHIESNVITKNSNIALFIFGMHRDPEYFPEPEKFDPDRFDNYNGLPFSYIPFSAGPRNCIGQKLAMLEIKSIISKVIRHFEIQQANPRHTPILSAELILKSTNGLKVGLRKRE